MAAVGNARPRGRGRQGGGLPRGYQTLPLRIPPGQAPQLRQRLGIGGNGNGGTPAPAGPRTPRVNPPGVGMMNPPGQGPAPGRGRGRGRGQGQGQGGAAGSPRHNGNGPGVGAAALPGPGGRQLAARVASGAITQEQAQRTMKQRQTLEKAYGKDWRSKISAAAGGKTFAQVRKGLAKNPGNAKLAALNKKLLEGRKAALEAARKKNAGGGKKQPATEGAE